ncbi:hypothetical protein SeMB42_g01553 [Synchytrium endobioticum]|uniref:Uncharacterized protein n=1 Tax=Synchytrium endobioticum TaxID=286115 RepID=A0A507CKR2_9FUNG|nr:hypothetical protein SeLEV6574_g07539 [Synchytrium endobioticum]TPX52246.1 hypothetical protein SeMB42_g01553 [Synchytrium endobioticum]
MKLPRLILALLLLTLALAFVLNALPLDIRNVCPRLGVKLETTPSTTLPERRHHIASSKIKRGVSNVLRYAKVRLGHTKDFAARICNRVTWFAGAAWQKTASASNQTANGFKNFVSKIWTWLKSKFTTLAAPDTPFTHPTHSEPHSAGSDGRCSRAGGGGGGSVDSGNTNIEIVDDGSSSAEYGGEDDGEGNLRTSSMAVEDQSIPTRVIATRPSINVDTSFSGAVIGTLLRWNEFDARILEEAGALLVPHLIQGTGLLHDVMNSEIAQETVLVFARLANENSPNTFFGREQHTDLVTAIQTEYARFVAHVRTLPEFIIRDAAAFIPELVSNIPHIMELVKALRVMRDEDWDNPRRVVNFVGNGVIPFTSSLSTVSVSRVVATAHWHFIEQIVQFNSFAQSEAARRALNFEKLSIGVAEQLNPNLAAIFRIAWDEYRKIRSSPPSADVHAATAGSIASVLDCLHQIPDATLDSVTETVVDQLKHLLVSLETALRSPLAASAYESTPSLSSSRGHQGTELPGTSDTRISSVRPHPPPPPTDAEASITEAVVRFLERLQQMPPGTLQSAAKTVVERLRPLLGAWEALLISPYAEYMATTIADRARGYTNGMSGVKYADWISTAPTQLRELVPRLSVLLDDVPTFVSLLELNIPKIIRLLETLSNHRNNQESGSIWMRMSSGIAVARDILPMATSINNIRHSLGILTRHWVLMRSIPHFIEFAKNDIARHVFDAEHLTVSMIERLTNAEIGDVVRAIWTEVRVLQGYASPLTHQPAMQSSSAMDYAQDGTNDHHHSDPIPEAVMPSEEDRRRTITIPADEHETHIQGSSEEPPLPLSSFPHEVPAEIENEDNFERSSGGSAPSTDHPSAGSGSPPLETYILSLIDDGWRGHSSAAQSDDQSAKGTHDVLNLYESLWSGRSSPAQVIGRTSGTSSGSSISNARALSRD